MCLTSLQPLQQLEIFVAFLLFSSRVQDVSKNVAPKTFWNIFTLVKCFCVKFCKFVGNSYPYLIQVQTCQIIISCSFHIIFVLPQRLIDSVIHTSFCPVILTISYHISTQSRLLQCSTSKQLVRMNLRAYD